MIRGVLGSRAGIGGVLGSGRGGGRNGLLTGLVGYWALDEAGGANNALDKHTGGLTFTQVNNPGSTTGKVYAGARTTAAASGQYFYRASEAAMQLADIDFAVAAWVYQPALQTGVLFSQWEEASNKRTFRLFALSGGTMNFTMSNDGLSVTNVPVASTATAWHLIIAWHDATANKIYISIDNGTPQEAAHTGGAYTNATAQFRIGAQQVGSGSIITGTLGPIAFWKNRTLSAADRAALYNGGAGLAYSAFTA